MLPLQGISLNITQLGSLTCPCVFLAAETDGTPLSQSGSLRGRVFVIEGRRILSAGRMGSLRMCLCTGPSQLPDLESSVCREGLTNRYFIIRVHGELPEGGHVRLRAELLLPQPRGDTPPLGYSCNLIIFNTGERKIEVTVFFNGPPSHLFILYNKASCRFRAF